MAITDLDEQLLVRAHQAGDEHAFGQIVRTQHRALYTHAYRRLGSHEAAEDAVQDTLLRAYRALPSFDGDLRLRAWLHRILTNVCHDEGNRRRRQVGLIDKLEAQPVELAPDPVEEAVLHDTVAIMNTALAELPESYREALVLRYVDGLSFRDVADTIGTTEENARARVHRGRLALHKILSRVSLMVAFLVPGLRRTQTAPAEAGSAVNAAEPSMTLVTQLTSHAAAAAPTISRVAEVAAATSGAKTSMVATAVAAVAAVAAPVAAYKVYDTAQQPSTPPAAVASPAEDEEPDGPADAPVGSGTIAPGPSSTVPPPSTSSTLPRSAAEPFADPPVVEVEVDADASTSTTEPTPTTTAPPAPEVETVVGSLAGEAFELTGARPDYSISGHVTLTGPDGASWTGTLAGKVSVPDRIGVEADAELELTLGDGRVVPVRFRGVLDNEERADGASTFALRGRYAVTGAEEIGLAETGAAAATLRIVDGGAGSLTIELSGERPRTDDD